MKPLKVKLLAHKGADESVFSKGQEKFKKVAGEIDIEFVDTDPDVLYFLTGGSERSAIGSMEKGGFYLMIANSESNSNASAMEVKAALRKMEVGAVLLDEEEEATLQTLIRFSKAKSALAQLDGQSLGLIGEVSEWLVASDIKPEILKSSFGINLKKISWESLPDFKDMMSPIEFREMFAMGNAQEVEKAGQVYSLIKSSIEKQKFDAVTVECFSLVQNKSVSGCLALAMLNYEGIPAACEGDIASAAGMMLSKALTGQIPWMANVSKIGYEKTLLAHCTIAPNLVSDFTIDTHFETGVGTAIQGKFIEDEITAFRFDESVSRLFVAKGKVKNRPQYSNACRTQVEVVFPKSSVDCLRDNPLGNHHLILPGDHLEELNLIGRLLNLELVN